MVEGYFTEQEMANLMRLKESTLRSRRATGTEHPPYIEVRRGFVLYPKQDYFEWLAERPRRREVRSAS